MRIPKPGDPCPCCGQPIKEGLSVDKITLLSYIQYGLELRKSPKGDKHDETVDI